MTRDEALKNLKLYKECVGMPKEFEDALDMAIEALERKRGKWIQIEDADANGNAWYECPFCRKGDCHAVSQTVSYCWNCGADMRGDND